MLHTLQRIAGFIDGLSERTGQVIAWLTLGTVLLTFTVVVLRYGFDTGSIAMQEAVSYLHAAVFMLGAAYTLKHDGHVRVDIVYRRLSSRGRAMVNLLGTLLLLLPVCLYILASSWEYVAISWSLHEGSQEAGGLDAVFLLKTAIPVMAVLLLLQGIAIAIHSLLQLLGVERVDGEQPDREL
jgi:TRAP-type mannitol/chloroaromatic compound transport system permease small subunit